LARFGSGRVTLPFWKMHGAGNDFILFDDRSGNIPISDPSRLMAWADRRLGVGADGVILIQPSESATFRMRFFNQDGGEAEMCANGARCVSRLAFDLGVAPREMQIETMAGRLGAEMVGEQVKLAMMEPHDWCLDGELELDGTAQGYASLNTGVPHVILECMDVASVDVVETGRALRYHDAFAPAGTNANFVEVCGPQSLRARTYERGVEAETLACGTGVVACALVEAKRSRVTAPIEVTCASGSILTVDFRLTAAGAENVTLLGPAQYVFEGVLEVQ
jgi:diaminopimelate epimerase